MGKAKRKKGGIKNYREIERNIWRYIYWDNDLKGINWPIWDNRRRQGKASVSDEREFVQSSSVGLRKRDGKGAGRSKDRKENDKDNCVCRRYSADGGEWREDE